MKARTLLHILSVCLIGINVGCVTRPLQFNPTDEQYVDARHLNTITPVTTGIWRMDLPANHTITFIPWLDGAHWYHYAYIMVEGKLDRHKLDKNMPRDRSLTLGSYDQPKKVLFLLFFDHPSFPKPFRPYYKVFDGGPSIWMLGMEDRPGSEDDDYNDWVVQVILLPTTAASPPWHDTP